MENFEESEQIEQEETLPPQPSPKKKYLLIGIITALVVLIGSAGIFVLLMQKETPSQAPEVINPDAITQDETVLSVSGWKSADLPGSSIEFSYPSNWIFSCCGDTDSFSSHFIHPFSATTTEIVKQPHVLIKDFFLLGCSDEKDQCSIDERIRILSDTFYQRMKKEIDDTGGHRMFPGIKDLSWERQVYYVEGLHVTVPVPRYLGRIESEIPGSVEVYLIKTDNGVVAVIFWRSEHFDNIFVREFLKRVKAFRFDDSEDSSLTIEELENAEYFGDGVDGRIVKLVDGHYERSFPGMASQYTISLNDKVAFGDLDNDGDNDAAVILAESGGGSGTFMLLVIVENDGGKPRYVTHIELGDRIGINAIEINVENIVVNLLMHAKEDGLCCPSVPTIKLFSLLEGKLVESDQTKQTDFSFSFSQWETYRNDEYDFEFKYPKEFFTNTDTPNFIKLSEDELFFQAQFALVIDMSVRSVGQGEFPYFEKLTMPTFFRLDTSILQKNIEGEIKTTFSGDPPRGYHYVFIPLPSNDNKGVQFSISTSNAEYPGYGGSFRGIETTSRILSTFRFVE